LHFINGLRGQSKPCARDPDRKPDHSRRVGFRFHPGVDFKQVYRTAASSAKFHTPDRRAGKTVIACQTALAKRRRCRSDRAGDISASVVDESHPLFGACRQARTRGRNDADLAEIAEIPQQKRKRRVVRRVRLPGRASGDLAVADRLKARSRIRRAAKDFLEHNNPYNIGMTGMLGNEAGYMPCWDCDALLMLGADFAWRQF